MALLSMALLATSCSPSATSQAQNSTPQAMAQVTVTIPTSVTDLERTLQAVIARVQPAIVEVQSFGAQGQAVGSGDVVSANGFLITNDHVVHGYQRSVVVLATGETLPAVIVAEAPTNDLAVLKINASGLQPINWGDSDTLQAGSLVLAVGSPLGLDQSATFGIVSALHRTASEGSNGSTTTILTDLIQTSAPINPGNSGGALVNLRGELVGIPTLGVSTSAGTAVGIGFAISSNRARTFVDQVFSRG